MLIRVTDREFTSFREGNKKVWIPLVFYYRSSENHCTLKEGYEYAVYVLFY